METEPEKKESTNEQAAEFPTCKECGRSLSQKTGECYYCKEPDPLLD